MYNCTNKNLYIQMHDYVLNIIFLLRFAPHLVTHKLSDCPDNLPYSRDRLSATCGSAYADRLLPVGQLTVLLLAAGLLHATGLLALYLRAYKEDVLCLQSLAVGLTLVGGTYYLAPRYGLGAILWLVVAVNAVNLAGAALWFRAKVRAAACR